MEPTSPLRKLPFMGPSKPAVGGNDAFRFQIGVNFKAKVIGIEKVPEARGDRMCQEVIQKQKAYVKAVGKHKQQIFVNVSLEGIKLVDLLTQQTLHHHPVQRISFISRDVSDARAFGYIYGSGDGNHEFFGLKTEKAAENLVLTLRDLFQVVFEMKKKEAEEEKKKKIDLTENNDTAQTKTVEKSASTKSARRYFKYARQVTTQESQESTRTLSHKEEGGVLFDLEGLGLGSFEQSQPNAMFDPMSGGGGGVAAATASDQFNTNAAPQSQFGFGGVDAFAAPSQPAQAPSFNTTPAVAQPGSGWTTFPQNQMGGGGFPPVANQTMNQQAAFGMPTNVQASQNASFGTTADPFQSDPFGSGAQTGGFQGGMAANWGQMQSTSNPFNTTPTSVFGAESSMAAVNGSSVNSAFANSPLSPTSIQQPNQNAPPAVPQRPDMFSGLVDSFGVDFGSKKENPPAPKINELASQNQVSVIGDNEYDKTETTSSCPLATEEEDPFDTSSVNRPINVQEMEMAPNVFTKTVSFSESENDMTPDRDVPAPSLPPPPLPSNVNKQIFPSDYAPTPPPRPMNRQISKTASSNAQGKMGLYSNVPGDPNSHESLERFENSLGVQRTPPPFARGMTVDLGGFLESPPPPPPRPGSREPSKQMTYKSLPRPHASPKAPLSPPVLQGFTRSPYNSPTLSRQATVASSGGNTSQTSSPQLSRQATLPAVTNGFISQSPQLNRQSSGNSNDFFPRSPQLNRQTSGGNSFNSGSPRFNRNNGGINSLPSTPPIARHVIQSNTPPQAQSHQQHQFEANFADFANFGQQTEQTIEESPPPPPPRQGSGRKRAPMLSNTTRSMTMPATSDRGNSVDSERSSTPTGTETTSRTITSAIQEEPQTSENADPFAVALGKPHHKTRNVNSTYARPRPRPRSKTPTLIATKTNLSVAGRSGSPQNQITHSSNKETDPNMEPFTAKQSNKTDCDSFSHSSGSPRDIQRLSSKESHPINPQRTGTPVSMYSMQSAGSGQSGEQVVDPFANVDPFETNKETEDPFAEKDPFAGADPFQSPTDPFSKELNEAEFKTKAIAITADGLEVEESLSNNNTLRELKVDPDPFSSDPFSIVKDPFNEKAKIGLGQPLIRSHSKVEDQTVDPFDTAYAADTLNITSFTPEFSNTFESGIVGHNTKTSDMFKELAQSDFDTSNQNTTKLDNQHSTWTADFDGSPTVNHLQNSDFTKSNQYCINTTSHVTDNFNFSQSEFRTHPENVNFNQSQFITHPRDSPSNHVNNEHIVYHRERHESDSTSYNSEISEAFASNVATPSSLPSQQMNGRGTPGNPFLAGSTPQNPSANQMPSGGGGSLLDF